MYLGRSIEARSFNHCCSRKAKSVTRYERVFLALFIQNAMRMRHVICDLPAVRYFSTLSHKRHDFLKYVIGNEMPVLIFSTTFFFSETFLILRRTEGDMIEKFTFVFM